MLKAIRKKIKNFEENNIKDDLFTGIALVSFEKEEVAKSFMN